MRIKYNEVKGSANFYYYRGATTLPDVVPDFSRGRKILFIHGAGSNGHTWHRQGEALGKAHSPIALDLPGHGRSAGGERLSHVDCDGGFIAALLGTLKIKAGVI